MKKILGASLALAVLITASPLSPQVLPGELAPRVGTLSVRKAALKDRVSSETDRRDYYRAVTIYQNLIKSGYEEADLLKPDINSSKTFRPYVQGTWKRITAKETLKETVSGSGKVKITIQDLSETERGRMRRFERVRQCPDSLKDYIPGFYDLCQSIVRQAKGKVDRHSAAASGWMDERIKRIRGMLERD